MNLSILIGRLGKDPVLETTKGDKHLATFSLATEEVYTSKSGEKEGEKTTTTTWHEIEMWNKENLAKILKKGMLVSIEGSLKNTSYVKEIGGKDYTFKNSAVVVDKFKILSSKPKEEGL